MSPAIHDVQGVTNATSSTFAWDPEQVGQTGGMGGMSMAVVLSVATFVMAFVWVLVHKVNKGQCSQGTNDSETMGADNSSRHSCLGADSSGATVSRGAETEL